MDLTVLSEFLEFVSAEKGLSTNTRLAYQRDLEQFFVFLRVKQLSWEAIELKHLREFLATLRSREVSARSIARKVSALKQFFQFLLREGKRQTSPAELLTVVVKARKLPKHLTIEESFALVESAKGDTPGGVRDRAMLEVWYATGCRVSELAGIRCSDIDWTGGLVKIVGKGQRERWVPLSGDALTWAQKYRGVRHESVRQAGLTEIENLFLTDRVRAFTRQAIWKWLQRQAVAAGIRRKIWPHMIRHTFATQLLAGGADLRAVQELLGHRSISTTEIYTHLNVENLKVMQRKYHPRS